VLPAEGGTQTRHSLLEPCYGKHFTELAQRLAELRSTCTSTLSVVISTKKRHYVDYRFSDEKLSCWY